MELSKAVQLFLLTLRARGGSPKTLKGYTMVLRGLVEFAERQGVTRTENVTPNLLRAHQAALMDAQRPPGEHGAGWKGGYAMASLANAAAHSLCKMLLAENIPIPDLTVVKGPRRPHRIQPRVTQDEFAAIDAVLRQRLLNSHAPTFQGVRDLALVYFLADTGLRAEEVCSMTVDDLDLEHGRVTVRRGKGGKDRALCIIEPDDPQGGVTLNLLRHYLVHRQSLLDRTFRSTAIVPRLWLSYRGKPLLPAALRGVLESLCQEAGIDGNRPPHAFRRAWFTEAYLADPLSLPILKQRMGWSAGSEDMVQTYTRGAEVELAATTPVPSVSGRWRQRQPQQAHRGQTVQPPTVVGPLLPIRSPTVLASLPDPAEAISAAQANELIATVQANPALARALLQALRGVA